MSVDERPRTTRVRVLIPVYEDWVAAAALLVRLDAALARDGWRADVLVVDDCSVARPGAAVAPPAPAALERVRVLRLRRNLGHQRAIAVGLAFFEQEDPRSELPVLVMDGDGEDDPADALALLARFVAEGCSRVVFAGRARRSEGPGFRIGYQLFKAAHVLLTGHRVRVGNFSVLPAASLHQLVVAPELWNHYAASVYKLRLPSAVVPVARSARLAGSSAMSWTGLVVHGLSAISVFAEVVGVRLLLVTAALVALTCVTLLLTLAVPPVGAALGPSAPSALALTLLGAALALGIEGAFVLHLLSSRGNAVFLPTRDHAFFHLGTTQLHPSAAPSDAP